MRQWITDRRVGADSLVWREGWPEWKKALEAFPSLASVLPAAVAAAVAVASAPDTGIDDDWVDAIIDTRPSISHRPHSRPPQKSWVVGVSITIIILAVLLVIALIIASAQSKKTSGATGSGKQMPPAGARNFAGIECGGDRNDEGRMTNV